MLTFTESDLSKSSQVRDGLRRIVVRAYHVQKDNVFSTEDLDLSIALHQSLQYIDVKQKGFGELHLVEGNDGRIEEVIAYGTISKGVISTGSACIRTARR